jgi:hypothetical protein
MNLYLTVLLLNFPCNDTEFNDVRNFSCAYFSFIYLCWSHDYLILWLFFNCLFFLYYFVSF